MNRDGHLNWKDGPEHQGSEARASRAIGGRYRIIRHGARSSLTGLGLEPAFVSWPGDPFAYSYDVEYRAPDNSNWRSIRYPRGVPGTLSEAKQMAEEDHAARIKAAAK